MANSASWLGFVNKDTRTTWKNPLVPVTATATDDPPKLRTVTPGVSELNMLSPPLKTSARPPSSTKGAGERISALYHQILTRCMNDCGRCKRAGLSRNGFISHKNACSWHRPLYSWSLSQTIMIMMCCFFWLYDKVSFVNDYNSHGYSLIVIH